MNYSDEFKKFAQQRDDNGLETALDRLQELLLNQENKVEKALYEFHKLYDESFGSIEDACSDIIDFEDELEEDPEIENFHNEVERDSKPELVLLGQDGNAFTIIGLARKAFRLNENYFKEKNITWDTIQKEMMSGDYDNLLVVAMKYFDVH